MRLPVGFSKQNALDYADLIELAYLAHAKSLEEAKSKLPEKYSFVKEFYAREKGEEELFGFVIQENNHLIVVCRGTVGSFEWLEDADAILIPYEKVSQPWFSFRPKNKVHQGFYSLYRTFNSALSEIVNNISPAKITILGHSLGAAITSYIALDLNGNGREIIVYSYASPRPGNEIFVKYYNKKITTSFRLVNPEDKVPHLPPELLRYSHVETEIYLGTNPPPNKREPPIEHIEQEHSLVRYKDLISQLP